MDAESQVAVRFLVVQAAIYARMRVFVHALNATPGIDGSVDYYVEWKDSGEDYSPWQGTGRISWIVHCLVSETHARAWSNSVHWSPSAWLVSGDVSTLEEGGAGEMIESYQEAAATFDEFLERLVSVSERVYSIDRYPDLQDLGQRPE